MRLVLLGTKGGPRLSLKRANPAQLIEVRGRRFLVDCGEGTPHQLLRAGIPLESVEAVLITHHHSDHNAAYGNVLLGAWIAGLSRMTRAYGPPPLRDMTDAFFRLNACDIDTRIVDEGRPDLRDLVAVSEIDGAGVVFDDGEVRITAALAEHPPVEPSFAFRFDAGGRSVVVSGDTAPCDRLTELATGADVLVHEVIHLDLLEEHIRRRPGNTDWGRLRAHLVRSHTPIDQVGKIAEAAGVRTLVLSHFVPGHVEVPDEAWLEPVRASFTGKITVGKDLMTLDV